MLGEMRTAALLAKQAAGSAAAVTAGEAVRMATLNGARALGIGEETGSLLPGKWADVIAIDMDRLSTCPVYDAVAQIVYAANREQVSDVWVAGKHLVVDGALVGVDETEILARAREWQLRIAASEEDEARE
jgi:5-methylthioadenosine/S-adenosylhomocysteine deaminase